MVAKLSNKIYNTVFFIINIYIESRHILNTIFTSMVRKNYYRNLIGFNFQLRIQLCLNEWTLGNWARVIIFSKKCMLTVPLFNYFINFI